MRENVRREFLNEAGGDKLFSKEKGVSLGELGEGQGASWAKRELNVRVCSSGGNELDDVVLEFFREMDLSDRVLHSLMSCVGKGGDWSCFETAGSEVAVKNRSFVFVIQVA